MRTCWPGFWPTPCKTALAGRQASQMTNHVKVAAGFHVILPDVTKQKRLSLLRGVFF